VQAKVLGPRGVHQQLAKALLVMWPSTYYDSVGTPDALISRLNSPTCTYPCQRFASALTDVDA
jgi:hypothetical protein